MGYDTFWALNPRLLKAFVDADRLRMRRKEQELYVLGTYMMNAVGISLGNAFRKKGTKPQEWLTEPYRLLPYTEEELEIQAQEEREKAIAFFNAMIPIDKGGEDIGG